MQSPEPSPPHVGARGSLMIDRFVPVWEWRERHALSIAADVATTYSAVWDTDLRSRINDMLIRARRLPGRARTLREIVETRFIGFTLLGEEPNKEIVFGLIGQFWKFWRKTGNVIVPKTPEEFAAFDTPGYAKLAWDFRLEPIDASHTVLRTETRIVATSPDARRRFRLYWFVVHPFSAWIRIEMLNQIRRSAETRRSSA